MFNLKEALKEVKDIQREYHSYGIDQSLNWEMYNHFAIVHHSTSIEGASLTEEETQLFLEEGLTAKGKPLEHHNMQKDHYNALLYMVGSAKNKELISIDFIKKLSALIMQNTGSIINSMSGTFDSSKGDIRLVNVHAGETRFIDFTKVPVLLEKFCQEINRKLQKGMEHDDALITSFDAHFNLVSIHPFADGNGRLARLVMNYIQYFHGIPLTIVFKQDKADYFKALVETRKNENPDIFREFMIGQHKKTLLIEINKVLGSQKSPESKKTKDKGLGLSMFC